jgi:hypothetical protein
MTDNVSDAWLGVVFRKSSYSGQNAQCVEVAHADTKFGVRDTKNPVGPVLAVPGTEGHALLEAVRSGQLGR